MNIDWQKVSLVIFDVDGTLYDQAKLRKKMWRLLLSHYLLRPWNVYDLQVIRVFRKERELMNLLPLKNIADIQYELCAEKLKVSAPEIKQLVEKWMHLAPLPHLKACCYAGVHNFLNTLQQKGIKTAVYSDYPATDKLQAMDLAVDWVVSSTDPEVDALKPHPQGLNFLLHKFKLQPENCLFIGDRDELDGACARQIGMPYLILSEKDKKSSLFYNTLCQEVAGQVNFADK